MKKTITLLLAFFALLGVSAETQNPTAVVSLVNRVCENSSASNSFTFTVDETFNDNGKEQFQIGGSAGAITIKGTTLSAVTCGLNWYLKHDAHVDVCWNNLTQNVTDFPAPTAVTKTCDVKWRYYLNYCTFSYSMAFWDWERWQKEIDWMALHGVNMALQCVGIDAVWYKLLTETYHYTREQANVAIAGPAYQAWWLMNNLKTEGGPNPAWWYTRQAALGKDITDRMRDLGITPCLPGYVGMAPDKYFEDLKTKYNDSSFEPYWGNWTNLYKCPRIFSINSEDPNDNEVKEFTDLGKNYYDMIETVFGFMPTVFSIDPFHERDDQAGTTDYPKLCKAIRDVMLSKSPDAIWVSQEWETNAAPYRINALQEDEHTLLLDLAAERNSFQNRFGNRNYVFCLLNNYGGNVGMFGYIEHVIDEYFDTHRSNTTLKGVGTPPEGIEQNPVMYELLFELPWLGGKPTAQGWLDDYAVCRYDLTNETDKTNAKAAWAKLLASVYNKWEADGIEMKYQQQGCAEPLMCIRPTSFFNEGKTDVSLWARSKREWNKKDVVAAALKLLKVNATNDNYVYDLVDVVRQVLADKAHTLLDEMKTNGEISSEDFKRKQAKFMKLIDDSDELLSYIPDFTMHQWVSRARNIATTNGGTTTDADWLEWNARQLVTTWTPGNQKLVDYANREWAGLLKDYYKARWTYFFNSGMTATSDDIYKNVEKPYVEGTLSGAAYGKYNTAPVHTAPQVRQRILEMLK